MGTTIHYSANNGNRFVVVGFKALPVTVMGATYDELIVDRGVQVLSDTFNTGDNVFVAIYTNRDAESKPTEVQLEVGVETAYEPYTGATIPVSWETEAGTVYGGELDVVSGVLTVTRKLIVMDGTQQIYESQNNRFFHNIAKAKLVNPSNQSTYKGVICDRFPSKTWARLADNGIGCAPVYGNGIGFKNPEITSIADWTAYFTANPTQFSYEINTPLTYQLTPQQLQTLLGDNVIWSDAGSVDVEYRADAKSYINNLFSSIQGNIAFIEDGTTASRAYTVGQYVIVNGTMYKVTAAIASGATFTPDTNIVATTVGTELTTALNA